MAEKPDITKTPHAAFLEELCKGVLELKPEKIAVVGAMADGTVFTHYYGVDGLFDQMQMACHLQMDAILDTVKANAKDITEAAEEDDGEL